ncbi:tetratricopeptide repeat protein [Enhygromyxa salina]|uniref:Outer membrane protein assembly factor BamD n=1 Tax=Enhygromyxa salina TaxID=215803 RepID=A0A2S9XQI3_9BACT|nr:outer membrane protein assembly factor BamD [Enhygromyxa salina]PRP95123.1 Outer membrane protein assembly factor BamD [Enhygromyxa salina]
MRSPSLLQISLAVALLCTPTLARGQEPQIDDQFDDPIDHQLDDREARAAAAREAGLADLRGEPGADPQGFEICAMTYLEVYNDVQDHAHADTLLSRAADCSLAAGMAGQAIQIWTTLLDRYPESAHAESTLLELAGTYASIAEYEHAATRLEQFAKRYAKHEQTPAALQNAYLFRVGLSQRDQAMRDLADYERLYSRSSDKQAAPIFWSRRDLLDSVKAQRKHALDYIARYDQAGGLDRLVVAHAVVAQIDWRQSCREPLLLDTCISIEREPARPSTPGIAAADAARVRAALAEQSGKPDRRTRYRRPARCGSPNHGLITVHRRDAKLAASAQQRIDELMRLVNDAIRAMPEHDARRLDGFGDAWGMAMVYRADQKYEELLAITFPDDLDFYTDRQLRDSGVMEWERKYKEQVDRYRESIKRLRAYLTSKLGLLRELEKRYGEVRATSSPYWMITAAGRVGLAYQSFGDQLLRAAPPRSLQGEVQVQAYCKALSDHAQPIVDQALAAWEYCVARSTESQFFTPTSRMCETFAAELDPRRYPATVELFGQSVYADTRMTTTGLLADPGEN